MSRAQLRDFLYAICLVLATVIAGAIELRYAGVALIFGFAALAFLR